MEAIRFTSRTSEVKALISAFMAEQEAPVERKAIAEYVLEHVETEVTDGVIAGAIKMMTASGEIYPCQRGLYERGTKKAKANTFERIYNICKRFDAELEKGCTFNMLELTAEEKLVYSDFSESTLKLRNNVRESMLELTYLLEQIHAREELGAAGLEKVAEEVKEETEQKATELLELHGATGLAVTEQPEMEVGAGLAVIEQPEIGNDAIVEMAEQSEMENNAASENKEQVLEEPEQEPEAENSPEEVDAEQSESGAADETIAAPKRGRKRRNR